jgi:hypothetical protein
MTGDGDGGNGADLRAENARLVALLVAHGIEWRKPAELDVQPAASSLSTDQKVTLFRRLFLGRTDVYPVRWESKAGKTGYTPACTNEWRAGVCEKPRIKCADCGHRSLIALTDRTIFIRAWRQAESQGASANAFVPLAFELGEALQFDWSEEGLVVGGIYYRAQVSHMKLCASRAFWLVAYPSQGHEMLFDAHTRSFVALGGVARRGSADAKRSVAATTAFCHPTRASASKSSCQPISLTSTTSGRAPYPWGCAVAQRGLAFPMILWSVAGDLLALCPERSAVSKRLSGPHQLRSG